MDRAARIGLGVLGALSIAAFFAIAAVRLPCPIELGNGEGILLDNAIRIAQGKALYVAPSLEFVPFVYMPLFSTLVASLVRLFGPALWEGRLVELVGVAGFVAVALVVVRRETRSWALALGGAGLFLMGEGLTRGGYDVIRPDGIMLMLAFAGLAVLRFTTTARGAVIAALLTALGFFDKQHGMLFGLAAIPWLALQDRRRFVPYTATFLAATAGGYGLLTLWLGKWFPFYTWDVPSRWSEFSLERVLLYVGGVLLGKLAALVVPSVLAAAVVRGRRDEPGSLWAWAALAGVGTGLMATLDAYAYYHTLIPTIAAFCVLAPVALDRLARRLDPGPGSRATAVAAVVLALQFVPLLYPMHTLLPRPGAEATRRDFVARLRALPGRVLLPYHGYYLTAAGKGMSVSVLPLDDVVRAKGNRLLREDPRYFDRLFDALRRGPGRPIVVNDSVLTKTGEASTPLWASLDSSYRRAGDLGDLVERLRPLAGNRNSPTWIYVPTDPPAARVAAPLAARFAAPPAAQPAARGGP